MAGLLSLLRLDPMFCIYQKIASGAQKTAPAPSPEDPKLPATPGHSGTGPEVKSAVLCPNFRKIRAQYSTLSESLGTVQSFCGSRSQKCCTVSKLSEKVCKSAILCPNFRTKSCTVCEFFESLGTVQHFCRLFDDFSIPGRFRPGPALKINDFLKDFNQKLKVLWFPAAPNPARRSKSILFQRIFNRNRRFFSSRPLPTRPGAQNRYFFKGF